MSTIEEEEEEVEVEEEEENEQEDSVKEIEKKVKEGVMCASLFTCPIEEQALPRSYKGSGVS